VISKIRLWKPQITGIFGGACWALSLSVAAAVESVWGADFGEVTVESSSFFSSDLFSS